MHYNKSKPVICVVPSIKENQYSVNRLYCDAVEKAGGLPVIVAYSNINININIKSEANELIEIFDGFIFTGGGDIDSKYFGEILHEKADLVPPERDEFELMFIRSILSANKPLLCICRGIQVLNVACGGTLIQHLDGHAQNDERNIAKQEAVLYENTILYNIYNTKQLPINSFHHQAIGRLGRGLTISGKAPDGCIEAVEYSDNLFAIGVQWHPECLIETHSEHLLLFKAFVDSAK